MARTFAEIKGSMTAAFIEDSAIQERYGLTPGNTFEQEFSKVSIENILFDIVAFAIWSLEALWDIFRKETDEKIAASRVHTKKWYRSKAMEFLYGYELGESDVYDTTGLTDEQIAEAKIVANAAVIKMIVSGHGVLRLKVVKHVGDELGPLDSTELTAFGQYMNLVSDAGTYVIPTTGVADDLKLKIDIYYDALVFDNTGARLDGTDDEPVQNAIRNYLKSLDFNGSFIKTKLEDMLQMVQGVNYVNIKGAWSKYGSYTYDSVATNVGEIDEIRTADAGYMKLDEAQLQMQFIPASEDD